FFAPSSTPGTKFFLGIFTLSFFKSDNPHQFSNAACHRGYAAHEVIAGCRTAERTQLIIELVNRLAVRLTPLTQEAVSDTQRTGIRLLTYTKLAVRQRPARHCIIRAGDSDTVLYGRGHEHGQQRLAVDTAVFNFLTSATQDSTELRFDSFNVVVPITQVITQLNGQQCAADGIVPETFLLAEPEILAALLLQFIEHLADSHLVSQDMTDEVAPYCTGMSGNS